MSVKSKDELRKLQEKKTKKNFKSILSALNEKERDLEKNIEDLEEKLVVRRFEEKIQAKQSVIAQLALKKDKLERKLKEPENKSVLEAEGVKQTEETNALPEVARFPKLRAGDLEACTSMQAVRKAIEDHEKRED